MSSNITVIRVCEYCRSEFNAKTTVTRFCSETCRSRANKARTRDKKIERSNAETLTVKTGRTEILGKKDFLTIDEACELLSVSRWTLWRAVKNNELPSGKIGKRVFLRRVDIDSLFGNRFTMAPAKLPSPLASSTPRVITPDNSYSIGEVIQKYRISGKALKAILDRNNIPTLRSGRFVYVPKAEIDNMFKSQLHGS